MPTTITVTYGNGQLGASSPTVPQGTNTINWTAGQGVVSITSISGLPFPPFTTPNPNGGWSSTDTNNVTSATTYPYNIYIWDGTTIRVHDPQITNEPQ